MGYVAGFNMLEPSVPARVPTRALTVAAEAFAEDQLSVVVAMCTGPVAELTTSRPQIVFKGSHSGCLERRSLLLFSKAKGATKPDGAGADHDSRA